MTTECVEAQERGGLVQHLAFGFRCMQQHLLELVPVRTEESLSGNMVRISQTMKIVFVVPVLQSSSHYFDTGGLLCEQTGNIRLVI